MKEKKEVFYCDCGQHLLLIQTLKELDESICLHLCVFEPQAQGKPTLWFRIKRGLKYIRDGKLYGDQVILNENEIIRLKNYIKDFRKS